jgi:hypothetical protein
MGPEFLGFFRDNGVHSHKREFPYGSISHTNVNLRIPEASASTYVAFRTKAGNTSTNTRTGDEATSSVENSGRELRGIQGSG